jgi:hypothetical protein
MSVYISDHMPQELWDLNMTTSQVFSRHPNIILFENEIKGINDREFAGIFTVQGKSLHRYSGQYNGIFCVKIPDEDRLDSQYQILTHNHPSNTSFSLPDLETASRFNLTEVRVVGETGVFSMKPSRDGWPEPNLIERRYEEINYDPEFNSHINGIWLDPEFHGQAKNPYKDLLWIRSDLRCRLVAEPFGLIYRGARWETL